MSFTKTHLKAARDHIGKKDYLTAKKEANQVLDFEPDNYNAHVFLGLSHLELGDFEDSEQIYQKAAKLNPTQPLAWQGISRLYEKKEDWNKYAECLVKLSTLFNESQDAVKCAESLQKLIAVRRNHGNQRELLDSLANYLRESVFYTLLSTLPFPDPASPTSTTTFETQVAVHDGLDVLDEMISLTETLEEDAYKREVEKRRMRLGASSLDQLKKEVFKDISDSSQLPDLYTAVLNHVKTSDELRRITESKLLRWHERRLYSLPHSQKFPLSQKLDEIVNGIVLLGTPDELAWTLFFEGHDCEDMSGYHRDHVRKYIKLFSDSTLASLFKGYFTCMNTLVADDDEELPLFVPSDVDPVDTLLNAYGNLSYTILGNRIIGEFYLAEEDYENAIKASKLGLEALDRLELDSGKVLSKTRTGTQALLITSLVHFYPPKHHKQASAMIDQVLARSPSNIPSLMGKAFVQQAALKWKDAGVTFDLAFSIIPDDIDLGLRAREEGAWCKVKMDLCEKGLVDLQQVLDVLNGLDDDGNKRNSDRARCLWRIGQCYLLLTDVGSAYNYFIKALKQDSTFAPAFTSLGIYYNDTLSPPDPIRASKCFQKAFELDAREAVAARQLGEGFANDAEWDLVEVVAQRTIDGEGGVTGGLDKNELDPTCRYLPTNVWAWKAIGVVKFHYRDYAAAIRSFQVALRVEPHDQSLWVHLGEAYSKAGRHVAALKALDHAHEMKPEDWVCSFLIADVKQRMGLLEEAILILKGLRDVRPAEAGILACLARSHLDLGRSQLSGFQIRAEESFVSAMKVALDMIQEAPGFRTMAWKIIADAAFHLSIIPTFVDQDTARSTLQAISFIPSPDSAEKLVKIIPPPSFQDHEPLTTLQIVSVAMHACLCQISLHLLHQTTDSTAWYDLSIALQSYILKGPPSVDKSIAKDLVIEYLEQALQTDPTNDIYWVALGNALFVTHAKAAQHAYIKALEFNSKNSITWVSLGLLYFYHGDVELANEAMYRAQVLDPDNTSAWVGQFLIALTNGHEEDAQLLLQHAVGLTNPISEADYEFAFRVFKSTTNPQSSGNFQDTLLPAFFLLNRYCRCRPNEESSLHLLALVCEKLGHLPFAETLVERSLAILETVYEETEDPEIEKRYAIANATLGRLRLSQGDITGSLASFEGVLGLLSEKEDESVDILRVQLYLGLGLAHFMQGDLESAIGFLEEGLGHAGEDLALRGHITMVLAQVIWSNGTDECKETAKSRVLECIASDPENLAAINILAGMGILTDDDGLVDAALSEVMALPIDQKLKLDSQRDVDYLLIQHGLSQGDSKQALSIAQRAVSAEPSSIKQRSRLASLIIQNENSAEEALALLNGMSDLDNNGQLEAAISALNIQAVAQVCNVDNDYKVDALRKAQQAILMRPSDPRGWQTLAYVRARMSLKL